MIVELILGTILVTCICILLYARWNYGVLESLGIPVIKRSLFLGSTAELHKELQHEEDMANFKKFGPIYGVYEGRSPIIYVADPELVKEITVKSFDHFRIRRNFEFGDDMLNEMLDFQPYDKWKVIRSSLIPALTGAKIKRMKNEVDSVVNEFVSILSAKCGAKGRAKIDTRKELLTLTIGLTAQTLYGIKPQNPDDENNFFRVLMAQMLGENEELNILYPLTLSFPILAKLAPTIFQDASAKFRKMVKSAMDERRKSGRPSTHDFLDNLNAMIDQLGSPEYKKLGITENTVMAQAVAFFVAGYDTMTTTLVFLAHHLAKDPQLQEKLHAEVDTYFENHDDVDFATLSELPYVFACLQETFRLNPPFRHIERRCTKDFTYNGLKIKEGMDIIVPVWALNRHPEYYSDPETFNPDRFLPENKASINPFALSTFGFGPRNCAGIRYSEDVLRVCIAKVFKEFEFKLCPDTRFKFKTGRLFMVQYDPVNLEVVKRNH